MPLNVVTTNNATGTQTVHVLPVGVSIGITYTLSLFGVEVSYTAAAATAADVAAGLQAAIAGSSDPEWSNCTTAISADGTTLEISYSVTAGALKLWRGDAPAVAQVTRITPVDVEPGGEFSVRINGKSITVTAVTASASSVATLLAAAINGSDIPEFREVAAVASGGVVIVTANVPGVPFELLPGAGNGSVSVVRSQSGSPGTNGQQVVFVPVTLQGTWAITWDDEITSALASGASAATVQTALQALAAIGSGNVAVSRTTSADGNDYEYALTFQGALADIPIAPLIVTAEMTGPYVRRTQLGSATGNFQNEIQQITLSSQSQYFTITKDAQTTPLISAANTADEIEAIVEALSSVTDVEVSITADVITVEFATTEGDATQSLMTVSVWKDSGGTNSGFSSPTTLAAPTITEPGIAEENEIQIVRLIGSPTGGTFTLSYGGNTTAAIAWNAAAATVETAFEALGSVGSGNGTVTGSAGGPWTIEFTGSLAGSALASVTGVSSLTGGSTDSVQVLTTTASRGPNHWDDPLNWSPVGVPEDFDRVRFESGRSDCLWGLDQSDIILTELEFRAAYSGNVGLPRENSGGYREYRVRDLTINCPSILIGNGDGGGSGKIQLNTLETTVYMEIRATGSSREQNVPAVTWYGNNQASEIVIYGGELGVAIWSDQLAVLHKIEQYGGTLMLMHCTGNYLYAPGQAWQGHEIVFGMIEA